MSSPLYTADYNQNQVTPDDALPVEEPDLLGDAAGASPGVDYSDDSVSEAPTAGIADLTDYESYESEDNEDSVIIGQDFGQQDIGDYNFLDPLDPSYLFLDPSQIGNPEGIESIYAPVERDPFRADWADGDFRSIAGYEGNLLSSEDMMRVQDAQNFLSNIELNARAGGWSTTEDYLRSLEQSDPSAYAELVEDFNTNAGIWDTYGDTYQFQSSYNRLQETEGEEPPSPSELTNAATALLQAFVDAELIDPTDASSIVGDPSVLADWYSNILQYEATADLTPDDPDDGTVLLDASGNAVEYSPGDTEQAYPFSRIQNPDGPGFIYIPSVLEGEYYLTNPATGDIFAVNSDDGSRRSLNPDDYIDYFTGEISGTGGPPGGDGSGETPRVGRTADGVEGDLVWHPNDRALDNAYIVVDGVEVPALLEGQTLDSDGRVVQIINGVNTVIREQLAYSLGWGEYTSTATATPPVATPATPLIDPLDPLTDYNQNGIIPDGIDIGETGIFQDIEGSSPNPEFGTEVRQNVPQAVPPTADTPPADTPPADTPGADTPGGITTSTIEWQDGIYSADNPNGVWFYPGDENQERGYQWVMGADGNLQAVTALRVGERRFSDGIYTGENNALVKVRDLEYTVRPPNQELLYNQVPLTEEGEYDFDKDLSRSFESVASLYFGDPNNPDQSQPLLDLNFEIQRGFNTIPVFDPEIFTLPANAATIAQYPNRPIVMEPGWVWDPEIGGLAISGPLMLGNGVNPDRIRWEDANIVDYAEAEGDNWLVIGEDGLRWPEEEAWIDERLDYFTGTELDNTRAARFLDQQYNDWSFNWAENKELQQVFIEELLRYSRDEEIPLSSITKSTYEDQGSYLDWDSDGESSKPFDIEHFMTNEDDDGDSFLDRFNFFIEERDLGSFLDEDQLLDRDAAYGSGDDSGGRGGNLTRLAFVSSLFLRPIERRIEFISNNLQTYPDENSWGEKSIPEMYYENYNVLSGGDNSIDLVTENTTQPAPRVPNLPLTTFGGGFSQGGYIGGIAGGMDDTIPATIDGSQEAALSSGEFVVPADVVSHLGDGNNQNGASKLYGFLDQVRSVKTGSTEQPAPFNDGLMSGIIGEYYER